ncbi:MAG: DMT family transporter [Fusobacteriaceae bacterium]|nr:DMT family transporter [Fusobacteriaceae bacterium]MBP6466454.1 DMT family transporter [Fusobacteriaceae bacterium]
MKDNQKAIVYILISALAFTLMSTVVKLAKDIPIYEKVFFRNIINLIIAVNILKRDKISFWGEKKNRKYLVIRGVLGLLGVVCNFYAVTQMNLSDASMLFNLTPFFVTLFAIFFLGERILKIEYISLISAFIAVLLVIKPQFNMGIIGGVVGIIGAACAGGAYTLVSHINKKENPVTIVFYFTFVSVILMTPFMIFNFVKPNMIELLLLILVGIFASVGQFMVTLAYKYGKPSEVAIYNYTSIVFAIAIGFGIWKEVPDKWSILGSIILIGTGINLYIQKRKVLINFK